MQGIGFGFPMEQNGINPSFTGVIADGSDRITNMSNQDNIIVGMKIQLDHTYPGYTGTKPALNHKTGGTVDVIQVRAIVSDTEIQIGDANGNAYNIKGGAGTNDPTAANPATFETFAVTDAMADGGGITLKGAADKNLVYNNTLGAWESNIDMSVKAAADAAF